MGSASVGFICDVSFGGSFKDLWLESEFAGLFNKYNEKCVRLIGPNAIRVW